jgi:hypothetical protein
VPPDSARFNAFGTPVVPAQALSRLERIALLRRAAGSLQAGRIDGYTARWLGAVLSEWLETGEALEALLGVRPVPGCTLSIEALTRQERVDAALLQLSVAVGGDREAVRVLSGQTSCPSGALGLKERLIALSAPCSTAAFTRARRRAVSSPPRGYDDA